MTKQNCHDFSMKQPFEVCSTDQVHELETLQQFTVAVFKSMSLVDHHTAPVNLLQLWTVCHDHFECSDYPMKLKLPGY